MSEENEVQESTSHADAVLAQREAASESLER